MKRQSIFFRILIPILSLILLCTISVSSVIYSFTQSLLYRDIVERSGALLIQIDGNFTNLMQQLNAVLNVSDSSLYFRTLLTETCTDQVDLFEKEMELHRFLYNYYTIFTQYRAYVTVIGKNGVCYTTFDGEELLVDPQELLEEEWARPLLGTPQYEKVVSVLSHPGITTDTQGENVLLFVRSLMNGYTMEWCGWMLLEINPTGFAQLYQKSYGDGETIFITDADGAVISSNRPGMIGQVLETVEDIPLYQADDRTSAPHLRDLGGRECLAVRVALSAVDGYLIKYIDTEIVAKQLDTLKVWIAAAAAVFCVMACLFSFLLFRHITQPIVRLSEQMASTRYGRVAQKDDSHDEIQVLKGTFESLLAAIDSYTDNIRRESSARREAELNALRMQINPHFLYNTLASIRYLIEAGCDRAEISNALSSFILLLRGTISNQNESIPLMDELENLSAYVALMNIRYEGRIHMQVVMTDPHLGGLRVPKLLLQPLVENSIFHGFPEDAGGMDITVYVSQLNQMLRIELSDNGCGIDEETLNRLQQGTDAGRQSMTGVGLNNIRERLRLMYGPDYGLEVCSTVGMGTIITLKIPISREEEYHEGVYPGTDCR